MNHDLSELIQCIVICTAVLVAALGVTQCTIKNNDGNDRVKEAQVNAVRDSKNPIATGCALSRDYQSIACVAAASK